MIFYTNAPTSSWCFIKYECIFSLQFNPFSFSDLIKLVNFQQGSYQLFTRLSTLWNNNKVIGNIIGVKEKRLEKSDSMHSVCLLSIHGQKPSCVMQRDTLRPWLPKENSDAPLPRK